jgi:hypothetical protein
MSTGLVARAAELSAAVRAAGSPRRFAGAVRRFEQLLAIVPDYRPLDLRPGDIEALARMSEGVIDHIEDRVGVETDSDSVQQELVMTLYDIRRDLEEIHRWHRHFSTPETASALYQR